MHRAGNVIYPVKTGWESFQWGVAVPVREGHKPRGHRGSLAPQSSSLPDRYVATAVTRPPSTDNPE